jgi:hypothetical protein
VEGTWGTQGGIRSPKTNLKDCGTAFLSSGRLTGYLVDGATLGDQLVPVSPGFP